MYHALLVLHLFSAASLFAALFASGALVFGAEMSAGVLRVSTALVHIGLVGVFVFGIWLAIDADGYELYDGWILIALGLWLAAGYLGDKVFVAYREAGSEGTSLPSGLATLYWLNVAVIVLMLADMVWKPWA
jgi:hypothetical protein